jgi:APA family basic amino acid/polyamine antiporter
MPQEPMPPAAPFPGPPADSAPRHLSRWHAAAMVAGTMIGVGIFLTPRIVAEAAGTGPLFFVIWAAGALVALAGALSVAELGAMLPHAGGDYVYLRHAYGRFAAFLYGQVSLLASFSGAIAAMTVGIPRFQGQLLFGEAVLQPLATWTVLGHSGQFGLDQAIALGLVWGLTGLACLRVRVAGRVQLVLVGSLFTVLLVGAGWALAIGAQADLPIVPDAGATDGFGVLAAAAAVSFAYSGWNTAAYVASEIERPATDLPWALIWATSAVGLLYLLLCAAFVSVLPDLPQAFEAGSATATVLLGPIGGQVMAGIIAVAVLSSVLATIVGGSRIYYAMAKDGLFFAAAGRRHPRWGTPVASLLAQATWTSVLITTGTFEDLLRWSALAMMLLSLGVVAAVPVLRRQRPDAVRPFRVWRWVPYAYLLACSAILVAGAIDKPVEAAVAAGLVIGGYALFQFKFQQVTSVGGVLLVALALSSALPDAALAQTAPPVTVAARPKPERHMRYVSSQGKEALETSVVTLQGPKGATIDLVSAIHIADLAYYRELQRRFATYDRLLFELVMDAGTDLAGIRGADGGTGTLQRSMKDLLALTFQLDELDYTRPNFVHADIAPDRLAEALKAQAGGIMASLLQWSLVDMAKWQYDDGTPRLGTLDLLWALTKPDRPRALKKFLARELVESDAMLTDLGGEGAAGAVLIAERNQVVVDVVKRQLQQGRKRLGIFYGAGHMQDMEQRLGKLGFRRLSVKWLKAWDLAARTPAKAP